MDPFDLDVKSGLPVHEALAAKHPDLMVPDLSNEAVHCFEDYEDTEMAELWHEGLHRTEEGLGK